jgi:hypothetical protein
MVWAETGLTIFADKERLGKTFHFYHTGTLVRVRMIREDKIWPVNTEQEGRQPKANKILKPIPKHPR